MVLLRQRWQQMVHIFFQMSNAEEKYAFTLTMQTPFEFRIENVIQLKLSIVTVIEF